MIREISSFIVRMFMGSLSFSLVAFFVGVQRPLGYCLLGAIFGAGFSLWYSMQSSR